ncbi:hypothetical protein [Cupriavidus consociatus]|uniref:hypothetical protein n=1 Tax=Cupriavidus consociatus TaxID=2821357 RepID=UPI001FD7C1E1|nr:MULTISPECIES: hypothetical protein [unclassified Cupriavidus]MDK2657240.1 hypothetical protein [Cupriavidus sp. LEh21]
MDRTTRECVLALMNCLRAKGPMPRHGLAAASRLSAAELTRALKSARQMGVVAYAGEPDIAAQADSLLVLTGRPLPPPRKVTPATRDNTPHFQPLLDAWGIARPARRHVS